MTDSRIQELEIKVAYLESLHEELNEVVTKLQSENYLLKQSLLEIRDQMQQMSPSGSGGSGGSLFDQLSEEKPPHY